MKKILLLMSINFFCIDLAMEHPNFPARSHSESPHSRGGSPRDGSPRSPSARSRNNSMNSSSDFSLFRVAAKLLGKGEEEYADQEKEITKEADSPKDTESQKSYAEYLEAINLHLYNYNNYKQRNNREEKIVEADFLLRAYKHAVTSYAQQMHAKNPRMSLIRCEYSAEKEEQLQDLKNKIDAIMDETNSSVIKLTIPKTNSDPNP